MKTIAAIIVAAGSGTRTGVVLPKQFMVMNGKPLVRHALEVFVSHPAITHVQPVVHIDFMSNYRQAAQGLDTLPPVAGGVTRQASVTEGLEALSELNPDYALIHDAARPHVNVALIDRVIDALADADAVVPALPLTDTVKRISGSTILETMDRSSLVAVQTPQGFSYPMILAAHRRAKEVEATDDAMLAEQAGMRVVWVDGERKNTKITFAEDFDE